MARKLRFKTFFFKFTNMKESLSFMEKEKKKNTEFN